MGVVDSRCLVGCGNHMRIKVLRTDELVMVREFKSSTLLISKSDRKTFTETFHSWRNRFYEGCISEAEGSLKH
jgi:hypothetical protein